MNTSEEIAACAARWVVEEGLGYGPAKQRALKELGLPPRTALPDNAMLEQEVRAYLALFCAETQPAELRALRRMALVWMSRLAAFRPHLTGAVWQGTATKMSDIHLQLFCDDSKSAELALINLGLEYDVGATLGFRGEAVDVLSLAQVCDDLDLPVGIHLLIYDHDDLRGALKPDSSGRVQRGDLKAVQRLMAEEAV
jgi:hypothetical protein